MQLAPLTFHAVSLERKFPSMETALEAFCKGRSDLSPRERQALFACVVSMFFHWRAFQHISLDEYLVVRASCARLAYACLIATRKMVSGPQKEILKGVFRKICGAHTLGGGQLFPLFDDAGHAGKRSLQEDEDPDALLCGIANYDVCYADIVKMVWS